MNALERYAQAVGHAQTLGCLSDATDGRLVKRTEMRRAVVAEMETMDAAREDGVSVEALEAVEDDRTTLILSEWSFGRPADEVVPLRGL